MRIPRLFVDQALAPNTTITLAPESGHYLSRVLRLPKDARVTLFNGAGGEYEARITDIKKNLVTATVSSWHKGDCQSPLHIHLAIGISRGERMDWVIQKSTELGVTGLFPLFSEHCEVKLDGKRLQNKLNHWRKVSISACEQSGLNIVPTIHPPSQLRQWLPSASSELKLILHPENSKPLTQNNKPTSVTLLVGPEGGFSDTELNEALQHGFQAMQLGPRILRTETAPVTAISILQYRWGDLGDPAF